MSEPSQKSWLGYYDKTRNKPPRPLLIKALEYVLKRETAFDIGAGALNDTRYLLEQGFEVDSLDKSPLIEQEAINIKSDKLHVSISSLEDFDFAINKYNIASAMYVLPFVDPEHFDPVLNKIKNSLNTDGVFCGQLFGINDSWSNDPKMTFLTKKQIEDLFADMELILLNEEEKDGPTARGDIKHWHVFHVITRRK